MKCATTFLASGEDTIKFEELEEEHAQTHPNLLQFPLSSTDCLVANLIGEPLSETNLTTEPVIKHWSHEHPLILKNEVKFKDDDANSDDNDDDMYFYNEILVNPEAFLYLCRQCDQCFHPKCTRPSQLLKLRGKVRVGGVHAHELTLVTIDKDRYPQRIHKALTCSQGHESEPVGMFLQCARCNYLLCRICLIALWKAILKELENED
ncbi:hypothetical protein ACET3Z_012805 [Daucus carota]